MKKIFKISVTTLVTAIVIAFAGFYIWSQLTFKASEEITEYVDTANIPQEENWLVFEPEKQATTGIILYPGAKVEPEAYSYYAEQLANVGYAVYIPKVNFNFAIFDINQAELIMKQFKNIENWIIGGHSLGGVAAASFTYDNMDTVDGLLLLASYPSDSNDFSKTNLPILSLYAENDGLTTIEKIEETKGLLSSAATLYEIKGGNHAQFGMYGEQKGDGEATISVKEQQEIMAEQTSKWLKNILP